jgi:shikimate kinase
VVFVGPPGAGKTTVADEVAVRLGLAVRDTDRDIEESQGVSVQAIFIDEGEAHFRVLEEQAVITALAEHDGVLSLGGGAVLSPAIREALQGHQVIFLDVGLAAAVRRVGMNSGRPLLLGNIRTQLKNLLDQRRVLYRDVARHTIDTDQFDAAQVADRAVELLKESA